MTAAVLLLLLTPPAAPSAQDVWQRFTQTYASAQTYRDAGSMVTPGGNVVQFETAFFRDTGLKVAGRDTAGRGLRTSWVAWSGHDPRCIRVHQIEARRTFACENAWHVRTLGAGTAPLRIVPALLEGRDLYPVKKEMTLRTQADTYELTVRTSYNDLDTYVIDRASFALRRVEHRDISPSDPARNRLVDTVTYRDAKLNAPVSPPDVRYREPLTRERLITGFFFVWCAALAGVSYLRTRRSEIGEDDRVGWHRLLIAAIVTAAAIAGLYFLSTLPEDQGHPPLAIIPFLLIPPAVVIFVSVACWMAGRQLALLRRWRKRDPTLSSR